MRFRPCIDIHNGSVKQIVGSSLKDALDAAKENFVSTQDAAFFAELYQKKDIRGGHIILLNHAGSEYFEATKQQALSALKAYPQGLQLGGGVTDENAEEYLAQGASHVIVTSFVFRDGRIHYENLEKLVRRVGEKRLVLDLSCKRFEDGYFVMTDRWQKKTDTPVTLQTLKELSAYCDEFLIHAVDVEGKAQGIEAELAAMLGDFGGRPVTYAGGVHSMEDLALLRELGKGHVDVTIGSALDLFGGDMKLEDVLEFLKQSIHEQ